MSLTTQGSDNQLKEPVSKHTDRTSGKTLPRKQMRLRRISLSDSFSDKAFNYERMSLFKQAETDYQFVIHDVNNRRILDL